MDVYLYMECLNMITNAVLTANFFVNILELKYNKSLCTLIFFFMCNVTYLFNLKVIEFFNMSVFQAVVYKGIFNSTCAIYCFYILSVHTLKKSILKYIYYLSMAYSVEIIAPLIVTSYDKFNPTLFITSSQRLILAVIANVVICVLSMIFLLIYFKRKNKIESNYMFLVLILPIVQIFILNKYVLFLDENITMENLFNGTIFFTLQIFINIIVLNLVLKSILSHDLEKKVFLANLENEKNKYVRDLYKGQKFYFNKLINDFKFPLNAILNASYSVKKNKFKSRGIFNIGLQNIIDEAKYLNNRIVDLLDKQKNIF